MDFNQPLGSGGSEGSLGLCPVGVESSASSVHSAPQARPVCISATAGTTSRVSAWPPEPRTQPSGT